MSSAATQFSDKPRFYPGFIGLRDSKFFGQPFYGCGQTIDYSNEIRVITRTGNDYLKKFYLDLENHLIGFMLLGDISNLAEYKRIYLTKTAVLNPDILC